MLHNQAIGSCGCFIWYNTDQPTRRASCGEVYITSTPRSTYVKTKKTTSVHPSAALCLELPSSLLRLHIIFAHIRWSALAHDYDDTGSDSMDRLLRFPSVPGPAADHPLRTNPDGDRRHQSLAFSMYVNVDGAHVPYLSAILMWPLGVKMPVQLIRERYFTPKKQQSPFVQRATLFQDTVIRCVRYAFAAIPSSVGKVFFSKYVALPFMRFRMLRHGIFRKPIYWREVNREGLKGIYAVNDASRRPDIVLYYCHGGE